MNIYSGIATAAFALFGCTKTSALEFYNHLVPIKLGRCCELKDTLIGFIYSRVDSVKPITKSQRKRFIAQTSLLREYEYILEHKKFPGFIRQYEMLDKLGLGSTLILGKNEKLIRDVFSRKTPRMKNMFDWINVHHGLDTMMTIESYDLSKISGDKILYRSGYYDEYRDPDTRKLSLHKLPVLSDEKKVFGSQFFELNEEAMIDSQTQEILTVMFGFGLGIDHFNKFAHRLHSLTDMQETLAGTTTIQTQIISGYPAVFDLGQVPTPSIVCG